MSVELNWKKYQPHFLDKRMAAYPQHCVCFDCRKMFKKHATDELLKQYASYKEFKEQYRPACPDCDKPMLNMGLGFKPPKRTDIKRWYVLKTQANAGKRFWYVPSWL